MSAQQTTTAKFPVTLFHPYVSDCTQTVENQEDLQAWKAQGWVTEEPDYEATGAVVEKVKAPAKAEAKTSK